MHENILVYESPFKDTGTWKHTGIWKHTGTWKHIGTQKHTGTWTYTGLWIKRHDVPPRSNIDNIYNP